MLGNVYINLNALTWVENRLKKIILLLALHLQSIEEVMMLYL